MAPLGTARYEQSAIRTCPLAGALRVRDAIAGIGHCSGVVAHDRQLGKTQRSSPGARCGSQDAWKIPWIVRIVIPIAWIQVMPGR